VFPNDVSDAQAFTAVWEFLFGGIKELRGRMQQCSECNELFYAYHRSQRSCRRECQMKRYRRSRRMPQDQNLTTLETKPHVETDLSR
jgi:hypothetical protein